MKKFTNALMLGAISIATLVVMNSCDKTPTEPDMAITPIEGELHYADAVVLTVTGAPADAEVTYESSNEWVAVIKGDSLLAWHVGEAVITATAGDKKATYTVKVTPQYTMATEPLWDWNCTAAQLKAKKGEPDQTNESSLYYIQNKEKGIIESYVFKTDKLIASALMIPVKTEDEMKEWGLFLNERYLGAGTSQDQSTIYFINASTSEAATMILLVYMLEDGSLVIEYQPYSKKSNAPAWTPAKKRSPLFL